MKTYKKFLVALLYVYAVSILTAPVFAAETTNYSSERAKIEKISSQTNVLQSEIAHLQQEVKFLKKQQSSAQPSVTSKERRTLTKRSNTTSTDSSTTPLSQQELSRLASEERQYLPFDLDVPGQAFVSTGPYVGVPIQYAGNDLIINSPSVNTDLQLLAIRKSIREQLMAMGGMAPKEPYHSHLLFSGAIQTQANYTDIGGKPSTSNIDVSNVSLDAFMLGPSNWILGFMEFSYDNAKPTSNSYTVSNSRLFVNKAFVTLGNLHDSPYYGTFGKYYVPFGANSSLMITDPMTKVMMRTKANALTVGVKEPGDNLPVGIYIWSRHINIHTNKIKNLLYITSG